MQIMYNGFCTLKQLPYVKIQFTNLQNATQNVNV